jgi:hypothetical protein
VNCAKAGAPPHQAPWCESDSARRQDQENARDDPVHWDGWGQPWIVAMNWGLNMWGFLYSPVTWTLIILILSGLGIFHELL